MLGQPSVVPGQPGRVAGRPASFAATIRASTRSVIAAKRSAGRPDPRGPRASRRCRAAGRPAADLRRPLPAVTVARSATPRPAISRRAGSLAASVNSRFQSTSRAITSSPAPPPVGPSASHPPTPTATSSPNAIAQRGVPVRRAGGMAGDGNDKRKRSRPPSAVGWPSRQRRSSRASLSTKRPHSAQPSRCRRADSAARRAGRRPTPRRAVRRTASRSLAQRFHQLHVAHAACANGPTARSSPRSPPPRERTIPPPPAGGRPSASAGQSAQRPPHRRRFLGRLQVASRFRPSSAGSLSSGPVGMAFFRRRSSNAALVAIRSSQARRFVPGRKSAHRFQARRNVSCVKVLGGVPVADHGVGQPKHGFHVPSPRRKSAAGVLG